MRPKTVELDNAAVIAAGLICEGYPRLREHFMPDCCIAAARMAIQVCRQCKLDAEAVAAKVIIYSPPLWRRYEAHLAAHGEPPSSDLTNAWLDGRAENGCHSMLLGATTEEAEAHGAPREPTRYHDRGLWSGHLVVLIENRILLDLSLPQVNRPDVAIELEPTAVKLPGDDFKRGAGFARKIINGSMCQWSVSEARGWETAPDWREKFRTRELAKEVRRAIERRLRHADR